MDEVVTKYINSHLRENIDKWYAKFYTQSRQEMSSGFEQVAGEKIYDAAL